MSAKILKSWNAALQSNDAATIAKCIAAGADVNEPISWDPTYPSSPPLCVAALSGECDGVRLLLAAGADVNAIEQPPKKPNQGWTYSYDSPLITAAGRGNAELVAHLLDAGADASYCSDINDSALHQAIMSVQGKESQKVVWLLLDRGSAPDYTPTGRSLLAIAAWNSKCRGVIAELVRRGADSNAIDTRWGRVPLHKAIEENNAAAVKELLDSGANPLVIAPQSNRDWSGLTPLDYAKKLKKKKLVEMLEAAAVPVAAKGSSKAKGAKTAAKAKPAKLPTAAASWDRLESCLKQDFPKVLASLGKPATASQVNKLIGAVKIRTTKEVSEFFQRHNGQSRGPELIELDGQDAGFGLLTVDRAAQEWKVWKELADGGEFADADVAAGDGVREIWWHDKWLPLAGNGAGDFLCFDFGPAKGGKPGQIIALWHEHGARDVLFESVRHLLVNVAESWEEKAKEGQPRAMP